MAHPNRMVYLDDPLQTTDYDTTLPNNGAPGYAGEKRWYFNKDVGYQEYVLVRNATGATIAAYSLVDWDSGNMELVGLCAAASPVVFIAGAPQVAIPTAKWGWALCNGQGTLIADANIAVNTALSATAASAAGRVDDVVVAGLEHCLIGRALEAVTGGAGTTFYAQIRLP